MPTAATMLRVSEIKFDDSVATASLQFNPRTAEASILLNQKFCSQHADTPLKLATLITHELLHHIFSHYVVYPQDWISNLAQDILVNSLICRLAPNLQQLFTAIYDKNTFPWMALRPGANLKRVKDSEILALLQDFYPHTYNRYNYYYSSHSSYTFEDVTYFLKTVAKLQQEKQTENLKQGRDEMAGLEGLDPDWWKPPQEGTAFLLGDHTQDQKGDSFDSSELDEEHAGDFEDLIQDLTRDLSSGPGGKLFKQAFKIEEENAPDELIDALAKGLREDILRTKAIVETVVGARPSLRTVVPKHIGRKELVQLAAGVTPLFWPAFGPEEKPQGDVRIYIDVSGSMGDQANFILMLMLNFKQLIDTEFFQFSTEVAPTLLHEFVEHYQKTGEVFRTTTGGTHFDPIFEHARDQQYTKIVIITDGEAGLSEEFQQFAKSIETYTVFTLNHSEQPLKDVSTQTWVMPRIDLRKS